MSARKHCLHSTGASSHHEYAGSKLMVCCNCNVKFNIRFKYVNEPKEGHGPFFTIRTEKVTLNDLPKEDCPYSNTEEEIT